ncbi:hypothetical protein P7C70_g683, partial [Phenoliferia sp. Uapishka_3]
MFESSGSGPTTSAAKLAQVQSRILALRAHGETEESSPELAQLPNIMHAYRAAALKAQAAAQACQCSFLLPAPCSDHSPFRMYVLNPTHPATAANGHTTNGNSASDTGTLERTHPGPSPSPPIVSFTPEQLSTLKVQLQAFKLLSRNQPVPAGLQAAVQNPSEALKFLAAHAGVGSVGSTPPELNGASTAAAAEASAAATRERLLAEESPLEEVEDPSSLVYPYNAFVHPLKALEQPPPAPMRRTLLIPTLLPPGLDPQSIVDERNRFIDARYRQRLSELENLPSTVGQGNELLLGPGAQAGNANLASLKLKALIELKSLNLLARQKALREDVLRGLNQASALSLPTDRASYRRSKKPTLRDARLTEQLERKQKAERERRAKQKHLDHLSEITTHGRDLTAAHRAHQAKFIKLGKALLKFHADAEKDEQRRVERVSKERLKALRADDEEGYLKLIDTAKDTRITHLLRQTDAFLDSLATAVVAQQNDAVHSDNPLAPEAMQVDEPAPGVSESTFGAAPVFAEEEVKEKVDYYSVAHRIKETITEQPKMLVGGQLKSYQIKGLEWMISLYNNHVNGILADEMGLGKTIQTISLITFLIESKKQNGPFLVIVPLSTMPNWILEFEKWAPAVKMISYKGTPAQRKNSQWEIRQGGFQVLLTTYEYIIKDRPLLAKIKWVHMIIDEGHRMKNAQSKLSVTLTTYYTSRYRLILTGTPLQNNLPELWALLNFVLPKIFGSVKSFDEWFNAPFANTGGQDKIEVNEEESLLVIRRLHKVLRPFLLRRLKKDVESDLPDKVERILKCKMSSLQLKLTRQIKEHGMIFTDGPTEAKKATGIRGLQNQIMQLRKICNHPFCFDQVERSLDSTGSDFDLLYRTAGKFELLDRILPKLFATGHRVLMFFQMTTVMTIFEDYLNYRRIKHLRLDGTTKHEDRATLLKDFNAPNSEYPIFILSTRAGGLGLNLQTADTVIIFDSDWNPHQDLQAQDRAHRIGQKKEVRILRLVTERSVEEQVMAGASRKIEMDKKVNISLDYIFIALAGETHSVVTLQVIQAGRYDNKSTAEERDEFLRALLEAGDEEVEEDDELDDAEALNEAIARSDEERALFTKMDAQRRASEEAAWRAGGKSGNLPERLIQEHELPEVYRMEHVSQVIEDEIFDDGARRVRTQVQYDDGLSEEQWLEGMQEDDDDEGGAKRPKRAAKGKQIEVDSPSSDAGSVAGRSRAVYDSDDEPTKKRKRARQSQAPSMTPSVNGDDDETPRAGGVKRRKVQLTPAQEQMKAFFDECLTAVDNLDNPKEGHQCSGLFSKLPDRRLYGDYYLVIAHPISLEQINKKVKKGEYRSHQEFREDIYLMLRNAQTYNDPSSVGAGTSLSASRSLIVVHPQLVFEDARLLREVFDETYRQLGGPE